MKFDRLLPNQLSIRLIFGFMSFILLTALMLGVPLFLLARDQFDQLLREQMTQGQIATQARYDAYRSELNALAFSVSQSVGLRKFIDAQDITSLSAYFYELQANRLLDVLVVCGKNGEILATMGMLSNRAVCDATPPNFFSDAQSQAMPTYWLRSQLIDGDGHRAKNLMVGVLLNDAFAQRLAEQGNFEQTLFFDGRLVATSLPERAAAKMRQSDPANEIFTLNDKTYFANRFSIAPGLEVEIAKQVIGINLPANQLTRLITVSGLLVAVIGLVLSIMLARRISRPLVRLADAAAALGQGNFDTSLANEARIREVSLVAQALETSGKELQRTLANLRKEKAWSDHLLDAIVEGIITLDHRGRIVFFSSGAERITGWSRSDVEGRSCNDVFQLTETDLLFTQAIPPPGQRVNLAMSLANGLQATLAVSGARLAPAESGDARVALVFRDVSEEETMHRLLGHFLANIAHEFRTPLAALVASLELLLDQAPDLNPAELHELLNSLRLGAIGLQTLVDNLLEGASIEAGRFRVYPRVSTLEQIVNESTSLIQPLLEKRHQQLTRPVFPANLAVRADPKRTGQALLNLLSNASKYSPDGSELELIVTLQENYVRVAVADRGPGIPPAQARSVFLRFQRIETGNDPAQYGVGLGLSVVKAIAEAQGGRVGVDAREGGGAIFWLTLPLAAQVESAVQ